MSTQHASLSPERWSTFSLDEQILMVGNEMNRAAKLLSANDRGRLLSSYERILNLVDLTIAVHARPGLRRELLRWRDLIALLYISPAPDPEAHRKAFRCLLQFTRLASKQIPLLLL